MNALILAADAHHVGDPAGDDLATIAYILLGAVMLITAVTTWIITPKGDKHH